MQKKLDEPRPPASTDSRETGACKQLSRSTMKYNVLAWLVRGPLLNKGGLPLLRF